MIIELTEIHSLKTVARDGIRFCVTSLSGREFS